MILFEFSGVLLDGWGSSRDGESSKFIEWHSLGSSR